MTLSIIINKSNTQHNYAQHNGRALLSCRVSFMPTVTYAECRYAECPYVECHYAECRYVECRYAECRYAKCRYAKCRCALMETTVNLRGASIAKWLAHSRCSPGSQSDHQKDLLTAQ
jgi:hypothetical protein